MAPKRAAKRGKAKKKRPTVARSTRVAGPGGYSGGGYPKQHVLDKMEGGMRVAVQSALASPGVDTEAVEFVDEMRQLVWQDKAVVAKLEPLLERLRHKAVRHKRVEVVDVSNLWLYLVGVHEDLSKRHGEMVRQHRMATALLNKVTGRAWTARASHMQRLEAGVKRIEQDAETYNVALRIFTVTKMAKQVEILRDTRFTQVGGATGEYLRNVDDEALAAPDLLAIEDEAGAAEDAADVEDAKDAEDAADGEDAKDAKDAAEGADAAESAEGAEADMIQGEDHGVESGDGDASGNTSGGGTEEGPAGGAGNGSPTPPAPAPARRWGPPPPSSGFEDLDTLNSVVDQYEPSFEELLEQEKQIMAQERQRRAERASGSDEASDAGEDRANVDERPAASPNADVDPDDGHMHQSRGKIARDRKRRRRKAAEAAAIAASAAAACRAAAIIAEADANMGAFAGMVTGLAEKAKQMHADAAEQDALAAGPPIEGGAAHGPMLALPAPDVGGGDGQDDAENQAALEGALARPGAASRENDPPEDGTALVVRENDGDEAWNMRDAAALALDGAGRRAAGEELTAHGQILKRMAQELVSDSDTAWLDDSSQIDARRLAQLLTDTVVSHVEGVADREVLGTMVKGADGKCHTIETEVIRRLLKVSIDDLDIRHTNLPREKIDEIKRQAGVPLRKDGLP